MDCGKHGASGGRKVCSLDLILDYVFSVPDLILYYVFIECVDYVSVTSWYVD